MKVCIYGAGAIGGWIGVKLAQAGCEVSVVARGATLEALHLHGLRLEQAGDVSSAPVRSSADPAALGVQDLVIVAVKSPSMGDVARQIGPLLGAHTCVLTAMNGIPWWFFQGFGGAHEGTRIEAVDPGGRITASMAGRNVIGCVVHASYSLVAPGFVRHQFGNRLILGEPSGVRTERVSQLAALMTRAGLDTQVSERIQKDIWHKLLGNMTGNPVSAITGATFDRVLDDPLVRRFISDVMREAADVGARMGIPPDVEPEQRHLQTRKLGAFKTSMLQDVEAGKPVELDALVGAVKELGERLGVATPFTDALLGLARLHARVRQLYPAAPAA